MTKHGLIEQPGSGMACRSSIFHSIFNFSSEMESGNIGLPPIACQEENLKNLKTFIALISIKLNDSS